MKLLAKVKKKIKRCDKHLKMSKMISYSLYFVINVVKLFWQIINEVINIS